MRERWFYAAVLVCGVQFLPEAFAVSSTNICRESLPFAQYQICSDENLSAKFQEFKNLEEKNFDLSQNKSEQTVWSNEFIEKIHSCNNNKCITEAILEGTSILKKRLSLLDVQKNRKIAEVPASITRPTITKFRGLMLGITAEESKKLLPPDFRMEEGEEGEEGKGETGFFSFLLWNLKKDPPRKIVKIFRADNHECGRIYLDADKKTNEMHFKRCFFNADGMDFSELSRQIANSYQIRLTYKFDDDAFGLRTRNYSGPLPGGGESITISEILPQNNPESKYLLATLDVILVKVVRLSRGAPVFQ